jgi:hypothetical protein
MGEPVSFLVSLAALAVLIVALVHLSGWLGSCETKDEKEQDRRRYQKKRERDDKSYQSHTDAISGSLEAVADEFDSYRKQQRYHDRKTTLLEVSGVTAAFAAAAFALWSAWIFQGQLTEAKRSTIEANRAWIAPRTVYLTSDLTLNDHIHLQVSFDDPGKGPAVNAELITQVLVVKGDALEAALKDPALWEGYFGRNTTCDNPHPILGSEIFWPTPTPESYLLPFGDASGDPIVTPDLLNGQSAIVTNGCIFYDSFSEQRHSKFCFVFRDSRRQKLIPKAKASICPVGNDAK